MSSIHISRLAYSIGSNTNQLFAAYVKLSQPFCFCSCNHLLHKRGAKTSRFPKEDGVTRLQEMAQRMNPPPKTSAGDAEQVQPDQGFKIDSAGQIFTSYVPPEKKNFMLSPKLQSLGRVYYAGESKESGKTKTAFEKKIMCHAIVGMGQRWEGFKGFITSTYAIAMIKRKAKPFKAVDFAKLAQKKYIDVNNALQKDSRAAEELMKEHATLMVVRALKQQFLNPAKKIHWRFIKEVERPRLVQARVASIFEKDNLYAQVTVRLHTEQILAIKDRYNRIIKGNDRKPKNVIDYVVFERHLGDPYGKWRICGKVIGAQ